MVQRSVKWYASLWRCAWPYALSAIFLVWAIAAALNERMFEPDARFEGIVTVAGWSHARNTGWELLLVKLDDGRTVRAGASIRTARVGDRVVVYQYHRIVTGSVEFSLDHP